MNHPERARKDKTIGWILGFFLVITAVMAVVGIGSVENINRSIEGSDWVNHTHAVILEVNNIAAALHAEDGDALTHAVAQDLASKRASQAALSDLAEHLAVAKALTRNEPSQHAQILHLEALANQRAEWDRAILGATRPEAARDLLGADAGVAAMNEIQSAADKLNNEEIGLLEARDRIAFRQARMTRRTVWVGGAVDLLLLIGCAWLISDDIKARRAAARTLREANDLLEAKVKERTAELASANRQLSTDIIERKWANQALEHQLRYNQLIINSIADMVFVLTKAVNISRINPAVIRLTGREPQELINQPFSAVVRLAEETGGADMSLVDPIARALIDGRDLHDQAAMLEDKLGRKTAVRLALFPLRDQDKVIGGVAILRFNAQTPPPNSR